MMYYVWGCNVLVFPSRAPPRNCFEKKLLIPPDRPFICTNTVSYEKYVNCCGHADFCNRDVTLPDKMRGGRLYRNCRKEWEYSSSCSKKRLVVSNSAYQKEYCCMEEKCNEFVSHSYIFESIKLPTRGEVLMWN
ncbi:putative Activin types I and II receptor domain-containing protein [Homarus americanus]|uniref:Putative Activin types I and II receptor domain-containing protein n=1 Tax=Homarus americanus TaxID=6706 RepID=A0A8J5JZW2_HOMAM|nr:putative Activin types I and II receptor domain-containing protein [Homarus americanus]